MGVGVEVMVEAEDEGVVESVIDLLGVRVSGDVF